MHRASPATLDAGSVWESVAASYGSAPAVGARVQHTVIGDAVNTASRLQEVTKEVGHSIIMSESTALQAGDWIQSQFVSEVFVRGKQNPLKVYCPLGALDLTGGVGATVHKGR